MLRRLTLLAGLTLWWLAVAAVYTEQLLSMSEEMRATVDPVRALPAIFAGWLLWVPLSYGIIVTVTRRPFVAGGLRRAAAAAMLWVGIAILAKAVYVYAVNPYAPLWYQATPTFLDVVKDSIRNNVVLAGMVVGVAHAIHFRREAAENAARVAALEADLTKARLDLLTAQLNPHFLFNALNGIAEAVHDDPELADAMIVSLASLLRESLRRNDCDLIPLDEELALLDHYLTLQRARLGDRLQVRIQIDPGLRKAMVPVLLLQPIVENAVAHGIARRCGGGSVALTITAPSDRLHIAVQNDTAPAEVGAAGFGIGLANLRSRLAERFGDAAEMSTRHDPARHEYRTAIALPLIRDQLDRSKAAKSLA